MNYISKERWCWNGSTQCPRSTSDVVTSATEYRYDQARERYYEAALNTNAVQDQERRRSHFALMV